MNKDYLFHIKAAFFVCSKGYIGSTFPMFTLITKLQMNSEG